MFWKKAKSYSDADIIEGFRNTNPDVVNYVYEAYFRIVETFIIKNGGNQEDVKDIYQDGLSIVYQKVQNEAFVLNSAFGTYLFSICKRLWFFELRKRKYSGELIKSWGLDVEEEEDENKSLQLEFLQQKKEMLFRKYFAQLNEECQQVIRLYLKKIPFREIAEIMGFESEQHAIKRKSRCKDILIRRVKNDPDYESLY